MKLCENSIENSLLEILDSVAGSIKIVDYQAKDRQELEDFLLKQVQHDARTTLGIKSSIEDIKKCLGEYLDDVIEDIAKKGVNEDFTTGVSGPLGLDQGIPQSGDGKGAVAKPLFTKKNKKKKKFAEAVGSLILDLSEEDIAELRDVIEQELFHASEKSDGDVERVVPQHNWKIVVRNIIDRISE